MSTDALDARAALAKWMLECAAMANVEEAKRVDAHDMVAVNGIMRLGVVPCKVINYLRSDTVTNIHTNPSIWGARENLEAFLKGCEALGVSKRYHFGTSDLLKTRDLTLFWKTVGRLAIFSTHNSKRTDIPRIDLALVKSALEKWPKSFPESLSLGSSNASLGGNEEWRTQMSDLAAKVDDLQSGQQRMIDLLQSVLRRADSTELIARQNNYKIHELTAGFLDAFQDFQTRLDSMRGRQGSLEGMMHDIGGLLSQHADSLPDRALAAEQSALTLTRRSSDRVPGDSTVSLSAQDNVTPTDSRETLATGPESVQVTLLDDMSDRGSITSLATSSKTVLNERQRLLIPPELANAGLSETELKRQFYVHELITTEDEYCKALDVVLQNHLVEIRGKRLLPVAVVSSLFSNLEQVQQVSKEFLEHLRQARRPDLTIPNIGHVLSELLGSFECYHEYMVRFREADSTRVRLERGDMSRQFAQWASTHNCTFQDFLIKPVQRITKYDSPGDAGSWELLTSDLYFKLMFELQEILKYTQRESEDYGELEQAIQELEQLITKSNLAMSNPQEARMLKALLPELASTLDANAPLRHGLVQMLEPESNKPKERYLVLFDHMLCLCKRRSGPWFSSLKPGQQTQITQIPTSHIIVSAPASDDSTQAGDPTVSLTLLFVGQESLDSATLVFNNDDERQSWSRALVHTRTRSTTPEMSTLLDPNALSNSTEVLVVSTSALPTDESISAIGFPRNTYLRIVNTDRDDVWKAEMNGVAFLVPTSTVSLVHSSAMPDAQARHILALCNSGVGEAWLWRGDDAPLPEPADVKQDPSTMAGMTVVDAKSPWVRTHSASGQSYWYNPLTKDSRWDREDASVTVTDATRGSGAKSGKRAAPPPPSTSPSTASLPISDSLRSSLRRDTDQESIAEHPVPPPASLQT
ncbi:hypothetical protein RI367_001095 [Sorochytrium milnesiophthora]